MSSRTPNRSSLALLVPALALGLSAPVLGVPAPVAASSAPVAAPLALPTLSAPVLVVPAPVPLPVTAAMVAGPETTLVVDLGALVDGDPAGGATVTVGGVARTARLEPVVADGLAVALVVDASSAGAATLPAWLSAAARFTLGAPAGTRSVVIPDRAPAAALTGPQLGVSGVVQALHSMRAGGERDTAAALDLASRQFPEVAPGRRVVLLYTSAADAGGMAADRLAGELRASGTILVVVGAPASAGYWPAVATGTGGFFAPAGDPVVVPALDQVETTLSGRYLVRFGTPADLPAQVEVRVEAGELSYAGRAVVESPGGGPGIGRFIPPVVAGAVIVAGVLLMVLRARRLRRPAAPLDLRPPPAGSFVGRAAVPAPDEAAGPSEAARPGHDQRSGTSR